MIEKISQSFMKTMREFLDERECGYIVKRQYVDGLLIDSEEPGQKELGSYFEFMAFGTVPKNGKVPQPVKNKDGTLTAAYRLAGVNAARVKQFLDDYGLKIISRGRTYTHGRFVGTIDIVCECTIETDFRNGIHWKVGDHIVIDTKYSGLLGEKSSGFNKHGWKWAPIQREYHGTQAKQYHLVTGLPFYFWVTECGNKEGTVSDMKIFHIPVDERMIEAHKAEGNMLFDKFVTLAKMDMLTPRPEYNKCRECPLREECPHKHTLPVPEVIDVKAY